MELTQLAILEAAQARGISIDCLEDSGSDCILLTVGDKDILFNSDGIPLPPFSYQAFEIAANKQLCKRWLEKLQIPHPKSIIFTDVEKDAARLKAFWQQGERYVCKPLAGLGGAGVHLNIQHWTQLQEAWEQERSAYTTFMLEEQKPGGDLRLQVIGGELVAACIREPAFVIGDGEKTLQQLVEIRQQAVQAQNPANKLELNAASFQRIAEQKLELADVPAAGRKVYLKYVANMNQGAVATDITDDMHQDYREWVQRISKALNLSIFALDVLTLDYQQPPHAKNAWALEINGSPYWYHHTFSEGRQHDIAGMILEEVFGPVLKQVAKE